MPGVIKYSIKDGVFNRGTLTEVGFDVAGVCANTARIWGDDNGMIRAAWMYSLREYSDEVVIEFLERFLRECIPGKYYTTDRDGKPCLDKSRQPEGLLAWCNGKWAPALLATMSDS
jgi:hypothetical protein